MFGKRISIGVTSGCKEGHDGERGQGTLRSKGNVLNPDLGGGFMSVHIRKYSSCCEYIQHMNARLQQKSSVKISDPLHYQMLLRSLASLPSTVPLTLSIPATMAFLLFLKNTSTSGPLHLQFIYLESFPLQTPCLSLLLLSRSLLKCHLRHRFPKDQSKIAGTTLIPQNSPSSLTYFISCRELNATQHTM